MDKERLVFTTKSHKKRNNKKKKAKSILPSKDTFANKGETTNEKEKSIVVCVVMPQMGKSTHNDFVGKYNPSYVLCRAKYEQAYVKYVGSPCCYIEFSLGLKYRYY
jgi:hypothetical protein